MCLEQKPAMVMGSVHLTIRKMKRQREEEEQEKGKNLSRNLDLIRIQTT